MSENSDKATEAPEVSEANISRSEPHIADPFGRMARGYRTTFIKAKQNATDFDEAVPPCELQKNKGEEE
ncbi:hypothetical protein [Ewingella americana]|uniref:hypothetical protein n=1 Tax=Ewingella americana TaxID=41202 RepID=UPI00163A2095|nr:hypothetical protein [Ewingella americana]QMV54179.1 hypothetical protein GXP68_23170 [Ewingella americana]